MLFLRVIAWCGDEKFSLKKVVSIFTSGGDMSVIGPRPLPPIYDAYYTKEELKRFEVRGGLIPPDSIDSSAVISWDKQFEYEANYAKNLSFKNDLNIFLNVFRIIFQRNKTDYGDFIREPLNKERERRV